MTSTESLAAATATPEAELQRSLRLRDGLRRLGLMLGIRSLHESLAWEKAAVERTTNLDFAALGGADMASQDATEDEAMSEEWVAGDKITHNHYEQAAPAATPTASNGMSTAAKLALAAALLSGGAGAGVVATKLLTPAATPAAADTDTTTDIQFPP